ncbi:MAG: WD40/YVTN/BNR-like repeat-containing protein, partial [Flavobacteriaceae bacterium]
MIHLTIWCSTVSAQAWLHAIHDPRVSFHDAQANFNDYWKDKAYEKGKGWKQYKRWENFMESRVNEAGFLDPGKVWEEIACYKAYSKSIHTLKDNSVSSNWSFIGPYNVPEDGPRAGGLGRLNCILVHPDNPDNLFVGTPSGGLWYTEDQAASWETETDFLPSLGISNIVIAPSNPNVMYASTGDDDGGQTYSIGILKSTDGGMSWSIVGL